MVSSATDLVIAWTAVGGICAAVLGARMWALYLITPAIIWFTWPVISTLIGALLTNSLAQWWWFLPLFVLAPVILTVIGLQLWASLLQSVFGSAGAHVGGIHISRFLDWLFGRRRGRPIPKWEQDEHE